MTTPENLNNAASSNGSGECAELASRLSAVVLSEKACVDHSDIKTMNVLIETEKKIPADNEMSTNNTLLKNGTHSLHNSTGKKWSEDCRSSHGHVCATNGFVKGLISTEIPDLNDSETHVSNGTHFEADGQCDNIPCRSAPDGLDASSASYFSVAEEHIASPGSESMVTASEGVSSRSQSSLSCPSSGSSSSSIVSTSHMSPERDCVDGGSDHSPSPSLVSESSSYYINNNENQECQAVTSEMKLHCLKPTAKESLDDSISAAQIDVEDLKSNLIQSVNEELLSDQENVSQSLSQGEFTAQQLSENSSCKSPEPYNINEMEPQKKIMLIWKELNSVVREIHCCVASGTVIEAGPTSIASNAADSKACQEVNSACAGREECSRMESKPSDGITCGNDDQHSLLTTVLPRHHAVRILSPVIETQLKEKFCYCIAAFYTEDPSSLILGLSRLFHEFCEQLKVKLLSAIKANPTLADANLYAKGICLSYQQMVCAVEAQLFALEKSHDCNINWLLFALDLLNVVVLSDKDILKHMNVCRKIVCEVYSLNSQDYIYFDVVSDMEKHRTGSVTSPGLVWWTWLSKIYKLADMASNEKHVHMVEQIAEQGSSITDLDMRNQQTKDAPELSPGAVSEPCECTHCVATPSFVGSSSGAPPVTQTEPRPTKSELNYAGVYRHIYTNSVPYNQEAFPTAFPTEGGVAENSSVRDWPNSYGAPVSSTQDANPLCSGSSCQCTASSENYGPSLSSAPNAAPSKTIDTNSLCNRSGPQGRVAMSSHGPQQSTKLPSGDCCSKHRAAQRQQHDAETGGDSPGYSGDDFTSSGASGDESDASSSGHMENHCECCYCHRMHHKQSGGRQRYTDRRDRLLRILNQKKSAQCSNSTSNSTTSCTTTSSTPSVASKDIDSIVSYIEGGSSHEKQPKKANKKQKQRVRKMAVERKQHQQALAAAAANEDMSDDLDSDRHRVTSVRYSSAGGAGNSSSVSSKNSSVSKKSGCSTAKPSIAQQREEFMKRDFSQESISTSCSSNEPARIQPPSGLDELLDKDGTIAQLRKRAPEVTVTLVKQDEHQSKHPIMQARGRSTLTKSQEIGQQQMSSKFGPSAPQPVPAFRAAPGAAAAMSFATGGPVARLPAAAMSYNPNLGQTAPVKSQTGGGLSKLIEGLEKDGTKDSTSNKESSQMVTIRRVMDPASSEPTVTITLKGEETSQEKVLYKLVNGQAFPGDANSSASKSYQQQQQPSFEQQPLPRPPPDLSPQELKKWKKAQKKERLRMVKIEEERGKQRQKELLMKQYEQQNAILKQQEEQLRLQTMQIQRQQEELARLQHQQQSIGQSPSPPKNNKKKQNKKNNSKQGKDKSFKKNGKKNNSATSSNSEVEVYDGGDDLTKGINLPPGVSIARVAGQPGMLTISNNPVNSSHMAAPHPMMRPPMPLNHMGLSNPSMVGNIPNMYGMPPMTGLTNMHGMNSMASGMYSPGVTAPDMLMTPAMGNMVDGPTWPSGGEPSIVIGGNKKQALNKKQNNEPKNKNKNKSQTEKNNNNTNAGKKQQFNSSAKNNSQSNGKNSKGKQIANDASPLLNKRMTNEERVKAALDGLLDPARLSTKQRHKYNKLLAEREATNPPDATQASNDYEHCKKKDEKPISPANKIDKNKGRFASPSKTSELSDSEEDEEEESDSENLMDQIYNLSLGKTKTVNLSVAGMAISCSKGGSESWSRGGSVKSVEPAEEGIKKSGSGSALDTRDNISVSSSGSSGKKQQASAKKQETKKNKVGGDSKPGSGSKKAPNSNGEPLKKSTQPNDKVSVKEGGKKQQNEQSSKKMQLKQEMSKASGETEKTAAGGKKQGKKSDGSSNSKPPSHAKAHEAKATAQQSQASSQQKQNSKQNQVQNKQNQNKQNQQQQQQTKQHQQQQSRLNQVQNGKQVQQNSQQQLNYQQQQQHQQQRQHNTPAVAQKQHLQSKGTSSGALKADSNSKQQAIYRVPSSAPQPEQPDALLSLQPSAVQQHDYQQQQLDFQQQTQIQQSIQHAVQQQQQQAAAAAAAAAAASRQVAPIQSVFSENSSHVNFNPLVGSQSAFSNSLPYSPFSTNAPSGFGFSNTGFSNTAAFSSNNNGFPSNANAFGSIGSSAGFSNVNGSFLGNSGNSFGGANTSGSAGSFNLAGNFGSRGGFNNNPVGFPSTGGENHRYAQYIQANTPLRDGSNFNTSPGGLGGLGGMMGNSSAGVIGGPLLGGAAGNSVGSVIDLPYSMGNQEDSSRNYQPNPNVGVIGKRLRKNRKTNEDLENVFQPNTNIGGVDQNDREVEEFKRFCLLNSNHEGEKRKICFDVKEILIKKN